MPAASYTVIVVGLGVMGSAIAAELAMDGHSVLGVDAAPLHCPRGASVDDSRMFRRIYPEDREYAEQTGMALRRWRQLESSTRQRLFVESGSLLVASYGSTSMAKALAAARGLPHHVLSHRELRKRYSYLRPAPDVVALMDPQAGILLPTRCLRALRLRASQAGAILAYGTRASLERLLTEWGTNRTVNLDGTAVRAQVLVVAIGRWVTELAPPGSWPLVALERTVSHWLTAGRLRAGPFVTWAGPQSEFCMLPPLNRLVKVKLHHTGQRVERGAREPARPTRAECREACQLLENLAGISLRHHHARAAVYTNTADRKFIVAMHPHTARVIMVSACSGHGFKFAPLVADRTRMLVNETLEMS